MLHALPAGTLIVSGTLQTAGTLKLLVPGQPASGILSLDITPGTALVAAGFSVYYRFELEIEGKRVRRDEIAGELTVDRHLFGGVTVSWTLTGRRWAWWATDDSWTRKRFELRRYLGSTILCEKALPVIQGVITGADPQGESIAIQAADRRGESAVLCLDLPPAERTRAEVLRYVFEVGLGYTVVTPDDGGAYSGGLLLDGENPWAWALEFVEPLLWFFELDGSRIIFRELTAVARPDRAVTMHRWSSLEINSRPGIDLPSGSPSLYLIRSQVVRMGVYIVRTRRFERRNDTFAIPVADSIQHADGSIDPVSIPSPVDDMLVEAVILREMIRPDGQLDRQTTTRQGWRLPEAALLRTFGGDYLYREVYMREGRGVAWARARFETLDIEDVSFEYSDGQQVGRTVDRTGDHRKPRAVASHSSPTMSADDLRPRPTIDNSFVYADGKASSTAVAIWGKYQSVQESYTWNGNGVQIGTPQQTYGWAILVVRPPGDNPAPAWYQDADGTGLEAIESTWQRLASSDEIHAVATGEIEGTVTTIGRYEEPPMTPAGRFEWPNGGRSSLDRQPFVQREERDLLFLRPGGAVRRRITDDGVERRELLHNRPLATHQSSAWTSVVVEALEVLVADPTAESRWGLDTLTIDHRYCESVEDGRRVALMKIFLNGPEVTVDRPIDDIRLGDRVEMWDAERLGSIFRRLVIAEVVERWSYPRIGSPAAFESTVGLALLEGQEVPL